MQKSLASLNEKNFAMQFALFGKGLMQNRFTLMTLIKTLTYGDIHLVLNYQGERIPKGEFILIQSKKRKYEGIQIIN